jgi:hypothetical protein
MYNLAHTLLYVNNFVYILIRRSKREKLSLIKKRGDKSFKLNSLNLTT